MNWTPLTVKEQLEEIITESTERPVMIFKHSIRCSISAVSLSRLERSWNESEARDMKAYFLDLINYRDLSNEVSKQFQVEHQSPQVLIIKNGSCVHEASHFGIDYREIRDFASKAA